MFNQTKVDPQKIGKRFPGNPDCEITLQINIFPIAMDGEMSFQFVIVKSVSLNGSLDTLLLPNTN